MGRITTGGFVSSYCFINDGEVNNVFSFFKSTFTVLLLFFLFRALYTPISRHSPRYTLRSQLFFMALFVLISADLKCCAHSTFTLCDNHRVLLSVLLFL